MSTTVLGIVLFIKVLLIYLSILNILKEVFRFYKSLKLMEEYRFSKYGLLVLGLSISYLLTIISI